jgi:hypothetical protein
VVVVDFVLSVAVVPPFFGAQLASIVSARADEQNAAMDTFFQMYFIIDDKFVDNKGAITARVHPAKRIRFKYSMLCASW